MPKKVPKKDQFISTIDKGYKFSDDSVTLGCAILDKPLTNTLIKAPLAMLNRHGLIAGATGTGKTRTLQLIAESLSQQGVPVLLMDIKGDLSGLCEPGKDTPKINEREKEIGVKWQAKAFPVEFLSISDEKGVHLRATVSEFGPVLFSRLLEINDVQSSVMSLIFKYCDDQKLPLLDLKDLKKVLQYLTNEGKDTIKKEYGSISPTSMSAILRKIIELEEQGGDIFFGEKSFDVEDLLRKDNKGQGYINILRLNDMQNKPQLFSTFMLCLMAEIYEKFPEEGDVAKPKLIIFMDEAHLIFDDAPKVLLDQISSIIKLIRSKGVGIHFCTQNPADLPDAVLSQLGMKIQHSLRAFTAKDRKAIKLAAENFPDTTFYDVDELLTSLGTGEALVTVLNEKGVPTPVVHTLICAPESQMEIISDAELAETIKKSALISKYNETIDRDSAYEILSEKLKQAPQSATTTTKSGKKQKSVVEEIAKSPMAKQIGRTLTRELTRGILGALTKKK